MFNTDRFKNANQSEVAEASARVMGALDSYSPEVQTHAAAAFFLLLCARYNTKPQDAFSATTNLVSNADGKFIHQFRAVRDYLKHEH